MGRGWDYWIKMAQFDLKRLNSVKLNRTASILSNIPLFFPLVSIRQKSKSSPMTSAYSLQSLLEFRDTDENKIISGQKNLRYAAYHMLKFVEVVLSDLIQDDQTKMPIHNWTRIT